MHGGLTLDSPEARVRIDRFEGRAFLDGDAIGVRPVLAVAGRHRVSLDGSIVFTGPSPAFDLGLAGDFDVGLFSAWFPALPPGDGPLQITGRVTGPIDDPQLQFAARTSGVTVPDIRVPASTVEGRISRLGIYVDRMRAGVGTGWIEAAGRLPLVDGDPASRFSLSWADVPLARLAEIFPLLPVDPIGAVATGSASLTWPGSALEFSALSGNITSQLRVDPELDEARIDGGLLDRDAGGSRHAVARPGRHRRRSRRDHHDQRRRRRRFRGARHADHLQREPAAGRRGREARVSRPA